eukprot:3059921-Pyramimonas_sp.AAC.1
MQGQGNLTTPPTSRGSRPGLPGGMVTSVLRRPARDTSSLGLEGASWTSSLKVVRWWWRRFCSDGGGGRQREDSWFVKEAWAGEA